MPTTNFNLPLYTTSDTAALDTLLNGQSNALDTALLAAIWSFGGTDAQRTALAAPKLREGITWRTTDTDLDWWYDGSGWKEGLGPTPNSALTYSGIYSAGAATPMVYRSNNRAYLEGLVISTSASFAAGTSYPFGTIPVGYRPVKAVKFAATSNVTVVAEVAITTAGAMTMVLNQGFTGALSLGLDGFNWRVS